MPGDSALYVGSRVETINKTGERQKIRTASRADIKAHNARRKSGGPAPRAHRPSECVSPRGKKAPTERVASLNWRAFTFEIYASYTPSQMEESASRPPRITLSARYLPAIVKGEPTAV